MILGITGGSGGGKTTLLREIERQGGYIIDCDRLYYELLEQEESPLRRAIADTFGDVFLPAGGLDRKKLAARVFTAKEELDKLNELVFYHLPREAERRIAALEPDRLVGIDAINLLESGLADLCHKTVAVIAPREQRLARIMQRDGLTEEEAARRIDAQQPEEYFRRHCDLILENDCATAEEFQRKAAAFLQDVLKGEDAKWNGKS